MDTIAESKIITINSANATRLNGSNLSNIVFDFKDVMTTTDEKTNTISLHSVEMPFSIYNVDENRNKIKLSIEKADTTIVNYELTLTEGNYNANTFRQEVIGSFKDKTTFDILMTISPTTGIFNLTPSSSALNNVIIKLNGTTCNKIIGLSQDTTFPFNLTTPTNFNFPANFLGVKKLSLYSEALAGNNIDSQSLGENTLINTISVNAPPFGMITFSSSSTNESILRNTFINRIDLQLKDEDGYLVDFNNTDFQLTFILKTYTEYKKKLNVGNFGDIVRDDRRDNAIRQLLTNPEYKNAPFLQKAQLLAQKDTNDLSEYKDIDLDILLE